MNSTVNYTVRELALAAHTLNQHLPQIHKQVVEMVQEGFLMANEIVADVMEYGEFDRPVNKDAVGHDIYWAAIYYTVFRPQEAQEVVQ